MKKTYYIIYKKSILDSNRFCFWMDSEIWTEIINEASFIETKNELEKIISSLNEKVLVKEIEFNK